MTVTVETLAAAIREALPECVLVSHAANWIDVEQRAFRLGIRDGEGQFLIDTLWAYTRADRDLARAVFDVIDAQEDRDGK